MKLAFATVAAIAIVTGLSSGAGADTGGRFIAAHEGGTQQGSPVTVHLDTRATITVATWDAYEGRSGSAYDAGQQDEEAVILTLDGAYVGATADLADGVESASASKTFEVGPGDLTVSHASTGGGPDSVYWSMTVVPLVETIPDTMPETVPETVPELGPAPTIIDPIAEPTTIVGPPVTIEQPATPVATTVPVAAPAVVTEKAPTELTVLPYTGMSTPVAIGLGVGGLVLILGGWGMVQVSKR